MDNSYQTENFLKKIKSMEDADLMLAYKNRNDYNPEFIKLLVEEMGIRGYDATEIEEMSLGDINVAEIKNKDNNELFKIYYKRSNFKEGWDIFAKYELKNRGIDVEQIGVKQPMFKRCFSFNGRIRRLEYGLSVLIVFALCLIGIFFEPIADSNNFVGIVFSILFITIIWFSLSQGARRCHDLGHNGWWQVLTVVFIKMLFFEGDSGINEYGENPKGKGNF